MTGEKDAPAEMPGVEEIGKIIRHAMASLNAPAHVLDRITSQDAARAVLALFAPILAEKELQLTRFRQYVAMHRDRALAAEAALAAARAEYQSLRAVYDASLEVWGQHAAAIRAEGE